MSGERDDRLVGQWAEQLRADLASAPGDIERASRLDLLRRGLDPDHARRFRGRVTLTVRCAPRKHLLGLVYPTAHLPVFVPAVSTVGERQRRQDRTPAWLERFDDEVQATARQDPQFIHEHGYPRDVWIQEDWQDRDHTFHIAGMTVIYPQPDYRERMGHLAIPLLCRCGERALRKASLRQAVAAGERLVLV